MFVNMIFAFILLGLVPLFTGCRFCLCPKKTIIKKKQSHVVQKELSFSADLSKNKKKSQSSPKKAAKASPIKTEKKPKTEERALTFTDKAACSVANLDNLLQPQAPAKAPLQEKVLEQAPAPEKVIQAAPISVNNADMIEIQSEDELNRAIQKPCLIFFGANWCSACSQLLPIYKDAARELGKKYAFMYLDVDKFRNLATGNYGITAIPSIIFFNQGKELNDVGRLVSSTITRDELAQKIVSAFQK